ncbi:hypothetical protein SAMN04488527_1574 [Aliiroseovarius crassostreae]|uniref:Secreted protein n=1 Tax=Aliiroseovarius crassostreae TaxID=154981 RepID=A0A0P7KHL9_9RHOB|nr:hypothetical protein [Aliiroseovarius crassostreae]KPN62980.1 hypothetical protein AKJ29_02190 [Aliiroseovarius crassostreae]SFU96625.1 hypothetical protein SAMN04488527_1574 [Aliiroseovarius crassostreae]
MTQLFKSTLLACLFGSAIAPPLAAEEIHGSCVGDACGHAELQIHDDGCVYLTNRSSRFVAMTHYTTVAPNQTIRVESRAADICLGNVVGQYQLKFIGLTS